MIKMTSTEINKDKLVLYPPLSRGLGNCEWWWIWLLKVFIIKRANFIIGPIFYVLSLQRSTLRCYCSWPSPALPTAWLLRAGLLYYVFLGCCFIFKGNAVQTTTKNMVISSLSRSQAGVYTCVATNHPLGSQASGSKSISVSVNCKWH